MPGRDDSAAYAANWKVIVGVDLLMGLVVFAGGVIGGLVFSPWAWALAVLGFVYLFFAGGRVTKWRRLRREAGL